MHAQIKIQNKIIGDGHPVFIIAEAGVNHNGSLVLAKKLVDAAVAVGADAVKFQSFDTKKLIRILAPKAKYQERNIGHKKSQYQMLKELEMSHKEVKLLKDYCDKKHIIFLSTPYDFDSIRMLRDLNVGAIKLASMDVVSHPLISLVARSGVPLLLSTGMANGREVREAVQIYRTESNKPDQLVLMHCNSNYPAKLDEQNLLVLHTLRRYSSLVGYSDHTIGNEASCLAAGLGARVIERHLTLDKKMIGPDHKASLSPHEFKAFVTSIRRTENILGKKAKEPTLGELENISAMRRSICAQSDIRAGEIITQAHLVFKRPGEGLYPTSANISRIVGRKARVFIPLDQDITFDKLI